MEYAIGLIIYVVFTIGVIRYSKSIPPYSILFLFMVYCFVAYVMASAYFQVFPEVSFLNRANYKKVDFLNQVVPYFPKAFTTFLLGYISFIVGFLSVRDKRVRIDLKTPLKLNFWAMVVLFLVSNWFSFAFRLHYQAAVAKVMSATHKFANYLWYSFHYIALILLVIVIFLAFKNNKRLWFWVSLFCGINFGLSQIFLGWKSGVVWVMIIFFHLFFLLRNPAFNLVRSNKLKVAFMVTILVSVLLIFMSYRFVPVYRSKIIFWNEMTNFDRMEEFVIPELTKPVTLNEINGYFSTIMNRLTGINSLVPIVAHKKSPEETDVSLLSNIFQRGSYHPEIYYGQYIIKDAGVTEQSGPTTHAPTGIGVFYIYGGNFGVIIGLILIGVLIGLFENTILNWSLTSYDMVAMYTLMFAIVFPAVVFEGTVFFFLKRHFGSLLFVFLVFRAATVTLQNRKIGIR